MSIIIYVKKLESTQQYKHIMLINYLLYFIILYFYK